MPRLAHVKALVSRGYGGFWLETAARRPLFREDGGTDIKRPGHGQARNTSLASPSPTSRA